MSIVGSMTFSWLLRSDEHTLELSAICELEKQIWIDALTKAIKESKELYLNSVDSNEYLLEQLFVSSFDQHNQHATNLDRPIEAESPVHFPIPNGSSSFSQSAIFKKPLRSNNRSSQPVFGTQEYSVIDSALSQNLAPNEARSPGLRSQSSISDLREFFSNNVTEKWSQRKLNQYHTRCKYVDTKFDDVCTTPILTARANSMNRNTSIKHNKANNTNPNNASVISLSKPMVESSMSPISHSVSPVDANTPLHSNASSRRGSVSSKFNDSMIFRLVQRNPSLNRSNSIQKDGAAGLLPPINNSTKSVRSTRFFGRMVEKLGQIGTPARMRKNQMSNTMPSLINSSSSTLSSKTFTSCHDGLPTSGNESNVSINSKKKVTTLVFTFIDLILMFSFYLVLSSLSSCT